MSELFPESFVAAIERLGIDVASAAPRVSAGAHLSKVAGSSLDFRDYRQYSTGDDLRRVDWNIYQRSGHLFVRQFDHPTTSPVHVLLDTSQSMFVETPSRYQAAARVAAAVTAAAFAGHDAVSIIPFSQNAIAPLRRVSGRRRLPDVLGYLQQQRAGGASSFAAGAEALFREGRGSGVAIIISDFFDEEGIEHLAGVINRLPQRHMVFVQIIQPWDENPALDAESELIDCETQKPTTAAPSSEMLRSYAQAYAAYHQQLDLLAARRASVYARIDASGDIMSEMGKLFPHGVLRVAEVRR